MIFKKASVILSMLLISSQSFGMNQLTQHKFSELDNLDLSEATFCIPQERMTSTSCNKQLLYNKEGFLVADGEEVIPVNSYDTDKLLRGRKINDIIKYGTVGKFKLSQYDNGEYKVDAVVELKGGGIGGAWVGSTIGYGLVTFLGHGTIQLIAVCTGPVFYTATAGTLHKMMAIPIHKAATAAGIAGGIALGVATGPA
ncbi:MAG: hypothetical protein NTX86_02775 [Candidatus Dependentiae bacterium]|nr:hypothetical protein [Candidatus Dependentiae bacterium]